MDSPPQVICVASENKTGKESYDIYIYRPEKRERHNIDHIQTLSDQETISQTIFRACPEKLHIDVLPGLSYAAPSLSTVLPG